MKIKVMICVIWPRHYSCVYPEPGINILILLSISIFPIRMVWSGDWWRGVAGAFLRSITLSQGCGQVFTSCWSAATRSHLSTCRSYFYTRKTKPLKWRRHFIMMLILLFTVFKVNLYTKYLSLAGSFRHFWKYSLNMENNLKTYRHLVSLSIVYIFYTVNLCLKQTNRKQ